MSVISTPPRVITAISATVALAAALLAAPAAADEPWDVVASGLDNPRQLSFTRDTLYVAEAGVGGAGPCFTGPEGDPVCFGLSGAVTRVRGEDQSRVLSMLPSVAGAGGFAALGPADIAVNGRQHYALTIGLGHDPAFRDHPDLPASGRLLGTVVTGAFPNAGPRLTADIGAFEADVNPDGGLPDTNPTGLLRRDGGFVLTDSGGNSLLRAQGGHVSTLAVFGSPGTAPAPFPPFPIQPVPTSVAVGSDGAYYVSELTGFPFVPGLARIHRVVSGQAPTVYATGLTNVTDLAWHDGALYAVQIADAGLASGGPPIGSLRRVDADASDGINHTTIAGGLFAPYGLAVHGDDAYVSICAVCPDDGAVIRVPLD